MDLSFAAGIKTSRNSYKAIDPRKQDEPLGYARVRDQQQLLLFEADVSPKDNSENRQTFEQAFVNPYYQKSLPVIKQAVYPSS